MAAKPALRLPPLPTLKEILQLYRLRALRQLSQNFLLNERITNKIVKAAGNLKDCEVCEVGPGPGGITRSILNRGAGRLIVIEKDKRFLPPLQVATLMMYRMKMEYQWNEMEGKPAPVPLCPPQIPRVVSWLLLASLNGAAQLELGRHPIKIVSRVMICHTSHHTLDESHFRKHLAEASNHKMEIILDDVLNLDMGKLFSEDKKHFWEDRPPDIHLIGNLPFSVATPLIIRWMKAISERNSAWNYGRTRMTLTFQKEVAERIVAPVSDRQRCRLSIMCQNWCNVNHKFTIPGAAFVPKPDVDVGVVHFIPWKQPIIDLPFKMVEKVVRNIFAFRQKYSIRGAERLFPEAVREALAKEMYSRAEINETTQPFHLTVEEFGRLCEAYRVICDRDPKLYEYESRACKPEREIFEEIYKKKVMEMSEDHGNEVSTGG